MKKTYINPNMNVVELRVRTSLLTISGGGDSLNGGSNGTYSGGVTLGSREDDDFDW